MTLTAPETTETNIEPWFDDLVATLRAHQLQLETGTASPALQRTYEPLLAGNTDLIFKQSKDTAQQYFISKITHDYAQLLGSQHPRKLALSFTDSEVLVWAEINDDDEIMERFLILTEAKINARYHNYGFDMTTMLVETSDQARVPNHYQLLIG